MAHGIGIFEDNASIDDIYGQIASHVLSNGREKENRTGTSTISVNHVCFEYNMANGYPLLTTKAVNPRQPIAEMEFFLQGLSSIHDLKILGGGKIWDAWADKNGELGPIYGVQWRNFNNQGVDQIRNVEITLVKNPFSRRMRVTAWNPNVLSDEGTSGAENVEAGLMALSPCHGDFQLNVRLEDADRFSQRCEAQYPTIAHRDALSKNKQKFNAVPYLDMKVDIRSNDWFLGAPFNIAGYAYLLLKFCVAHGYLPGRLFYTVGDCHIYTNHIDQISEQLCRLEMGSAPMIEFAATKDEILSVTSRIHTTVSGYRHHGRLTAPVAV